jgi:hypothetical protein
MSKIVMVSREDNKMGIILLHVLNVNNKGIKQINVMNKMIEMIDLEQEVLETSLIKTM